ncbi:MAG TPA: 2-hydroxychromene-2-carboxylate isomerase [Casimicrobiaceae bacterium]|nr:2-hydroxychromene-2-carboxylate isomerase [Casimicrobiaceae bacterium]
MSRPIDFYFDFSSPYGFLASERIESLAAKHGRAVDWHPILLGVVFKQTGAMPLTQVPLKGEYSRRDFARSARFHGIEGFRMPSTFPIPSQAPARIVLWTREHEPSCTTGVVHALYRAFFRDDVDISRPDSAAAVAARGGADEATIRAAIDDPAIKDALKAENEGAIAAGVFGSPFTVVDGEPFWGVDRLDQIDRWLATGGW